MSNQLRSSYHSPALLRLPPLPGRLFQLSTRGTLGLAPAVVAVLLMVAPRRRAATVVLLLLLADAAAVPFRAQLGMRSSGFVPCDAPVGRSQHKMLK